MDRSCLPPASGCFILDSARSALFEYPTDTDDGKSIAVPNTNITHPGHDHFPKI
jgi:hypothetical protein